MSPFLVLSRIVVESVILYFAIVTVRFLLPPEFMARKGARLLGWSGPVAIVGASLIVLLNLGDVFRTIPPVKPDQPSADTVTTPGGKKPDAENPQHDQEPARVRVPPASHTADRSRTFLVTPLLLVAGIALVAFVASFVFPDTPFSQPVRNAAPIVFAGSLALSAFEKLHLLDVDVDHLFDVNASETQPLTFRPIGDIGPFVEGAADTLESGVPGTNGLDTVVARMDAQLNRNAVSFVLLLGGVDKRQLRGASAASFGSNEALGKARARWTAELLKRRLPKLDPIEVLSLSTSSSYFGPGTSADLMRADRKVRVVVAGVDRP